MSDKFRVKRSEDCENNVLTSVIITFLSFSTDLFMISHFLSSNQLPLTYKQNIIVL